MLDLTTSSFLQLMWQAPASLDDHWLASFFEVFLKFVAARSDYNDFDLNIVKYIYRTGFVEEFTSEEPYSPWSYNQRRYYSNIRDICEFLRCEGVEIVFGQGKHDLGACIETGQEIGLSLLVACGLPINAADCSQRPVIYNAIYGFFDDVVSHMVFNPEDTILRVNSKIAGVARLIENGADIYKLEWAADLDIGCEIGSDEEDDYQIRDGLLSPTELARYLGPGIVSCWEEALRLCGLVPKEVYCEDEKRRREFLRTQGGKSSSADINSLSEEIANGISTLRLRAGTVQEDDEDRVADL